jgi:hypothetical protein
VRELGQRSLRPRFGATHYQRGAGLACPNEHEAALYAQYGSPRERIKIWPLGVDPRDFSSCPRAARFAPGSA